MTYIFNLLDRIELYESWKARGFIIVEDHLSKSSMYPP